MSIAKQNPLYRISRTGLASRLAGAAGLAVLLLFFLSAMRLLNATRITEQTLRPMESIDEIAPPPPPPLQVNAEPPPSPTPVILPRLDIQIENIAPPLQASLSPNIDLAMILPQFQLEPVAKPAPGIHSPLAPQPASQKSSYSAGELDVKPRLLNNPSPGYPRTLLRRGIKEGNVVLEVTISTRGRVSVKRVISSSDPEFIRMARSFAARSRFTVPKKNGQPVTATYHWPLILRP